MGRAVVIVDARIARRRQAGAASVVRNLHAAIAAENPPDLDVRFLYGPPGLPRRNRLTTLGNLALDLAWTHVAIPLSALRARARVIHAPFTWGPWWAPCPTVVTVQDVAWERVPEAFPPTFRRYARLFARRSTRAARTVITTSASTAQDLRELYGTPGTSLRTIPLGVNRDNAPSTKPREPFILAVGEFEPRKRILELVAAHTAYFHHAPADPPLCRLVLAGSGGSQEHAVREAAGPECELLGFVSAKRLDDLYRRATLLVYPSAYEGFGLPVIEAMAHGCPALIADNSSLPEVGGDVALRITDPTVAGIAHALTAALADREALAARGEASRAHAATFGWDRIARENLDVYREAIAS
jgi:glycosyltransferase involved in cell wall biosynthesis